MQKAIALTDFNSFPTQKKYAILEDFATYLGVYRLLGNYKIALFELSGYYVEVWLNQVTDKLWKAEAFSEYEKLDPYLMSIDLSPVYSCL
jgi:hypothetical protein